MLRPRCMSRWVPPITPAEPREGAGGAAAACAVAARPSPHIPWLPLVRFAQCAEPVPILHFAVSQRLTCLDARLATPCALATMSTQCMRLIKSLYAHLAASGALAACSCHMRHLVAIVGMHRACILAVHESSHVR